MRYKLSVRCGYGHHLQLEAELVVSSELCNWGGCTDLEMKDDPTLLAMNLLAMVQGPEE